MTPAEIREELEDDLNEPEVLSVHESFWTPSGLHISARPPSSQRAEGSEAMSHDHLARSPEPFTGYIDNLINDLNEVAGQTRSSDARTDLVDDLHHLETGSTVFETQDGLVDDLHDLVSPLDTPSQLPIVRYDLDDPVELETSSSQHHLPDDDLNEPSGSHASTLFESLLVTQSSSSILYDDLEENEEKREVPRELDHLRDDLDELEVDELISEVSELVLQSGWERGIARRERSQTVGANGDNRSNKRVRRKYKNIHLTVASQGLSRTGCSPNSYVHCQEPMSSSRPFNSNEVSLPVALDNDIRRVISSDRVHDPVEMALGVTTEPPSSGSKTNGMHPSRPSLPEVGVFQLGEQLDQPPVSVDMHSEASDQPAIESSQAPLRAGSFEDMPRALPHPETSQSMLHEVVPSREYGMKLEVKEHRPNHGRISRGPSPEPSSPELTVRPLLSPPLPAVTESSQLDICQSETNELTFSVISEAPGNHARISNLASAQSAEDKFSSKTGEPLQVLNSAPPATPAPATGYSAPTSQVIPAREPSALPQPPGASSAVVTRLPTFAAGHGPSACGAAVQTETVLRRIDALLAAVEVCRRRGEVPELVLPARTRWRDLQLCRTAGHLVVSEAVAPRPELRVRDEARLKLTVTLLRKIRHLVATNTHSTKRDIYYQEMALFGSQRAVDTLLDDVTRLLAIPRESSHVRATSKGLLAGDLVLRSGNVLLDCSAAEHGVLVPEEVRQLKLVRSEARFILVVEKDASFQKILDSGVMQKLPPGILITGKGFPDLNTRQLLRLLTLQLKVPALALVDGDPHGLEIFFVYKYGSLARASESGRLTTPNLLWLGIKPTEVLQLNIPPAALVPLTDADRSKARCLLSRPYVRHDKHWQRQIREILASGHKAEIQTLSAIHPTFLTDFYLPTKIAEVLGAGTGPGPATPGLYDPDHQITRQSPVQSTVMSTCGRETGQLPGRPCAQESTLKPT